MSTAPLAFTGISQFSTDFQTILTHAAKVAQIPVTALQNKDSDVLQKKTLLSTLNGAVSDLTTSLTSLGTIAASQALGATSSNPAVVSVSSTGATTPATYTINTITSAASAAGERSTAGFADSASTPVSTTGTLKLVVGSQSSVFSVTNNSLVGIRDKINSLGLGVTASILTTGGVNGNFLSISANTTGATPLQLIDDPITDVNPGGANTNLLTNANQGTDAVFELNGIPVSQHGNVVNSVVPGVTFTILAASATPVTLTLASDRTRLSSALEDFVTKYNALQTQLRAQVGPAAGMLNGDAVVNQLQATLRQITSYHTASGSVESLADLGVEFSNAGQVSFKSTTFSGLSDTQIAGAFQFLGSTTTGLGGFSASMNQFSDPVTGLIKIEQAGLDRTDRSLQNQISTLTERITLSQANLTTQLQLADALAAQLESQQQALTASLQGLSLVLFGRSQTVI